MTSASRRPLSPSPYPSAFSFRRAEIDRFEDSVAPLCVRQRLPVVWKGCDDLDPILGEELGQILLGRDLQDGQVAPVDDVPTQRADLLHEPPEVGVQLGGAAGDVDRGDARPAQRRQAGLEGLARHRLLAGRPGVHVAVPAGHVAEAPDVHLEDLDPGRSERGEAATRERVVELPRERDHVEAAELDQGFRDGRRASGEGAGRHR